MQKPVINVNDALHDLRMGLDDWTLMRKYQLSAKGLQSMFKKLLALGVVTQAELGRGPVPEIKAKDAVRDIRSGYGRFCPDGQVQDCRPKGYRAFSTSWLPLECCPKATWTCVCRSPKGPLTWGRHLWAHRNPLPNPSYLRKTEAPRPSPMLQAALSPPARLP